MTKVTYQPSSPYYGTPQTSTYLGIWVPPSVGPSITDVLIEVDHKYTNRPDLLSYDLYGTSRLWWVFSMVNPDQFSDPIYDLVAGMQIYVPSSTTVQGYI